MPIFAFQEEGGGRRGGGERKDEKNKEKRKEGRTGKKERKQSLANPNLAILKLIHSNIFK
jgi:hypothetical protein